ncbi:hypothetical protein V0R48_18525 [Pseudomonas alcaligenes]|uniref:Mom family adenine methylcarbamoylation protein n=1 Tax=Aquipseudomonas alcaligenes TaxID=43263 RepID=UPI002E7BB496|nr:hypothetical protein [Pseudomonas alcaligenes]MEE1950980.1 hypothetical protein [Pseudomonas alcaligenes]
MASRKDHHPAQPGNYNPPASEQVGYIMGEHALAGFGCSSFYIALIPRAEANRIIIANHYSGRIVNNSYIHLGVWVGGVMRGVLQFGYALNPVAGAQKIVAGTEVGQYLELNRMWLDDVAPRNSESRAISYAFKFIKRACPRVAWVQSFADERCGGWGVVYQAANFLYFGHHKTSFYELDGQTYHEMLLTTAKNGGGRGRYLRENLHRATHHSLLQFRYIYLIKSSWQGRFKKEPLPFPKPGQPLPDRRKLRHSKCSGR